MEDTPAAGDAPRTHGCMGCHAQQPSTIEHFTNGNTRWRCGVCGQICHLIPGRYTPSVEASGLPPHGETLL